MRRPLRAASIGAVALAAGGALLALFVRGLTGDGAATAGGHGAPDLAPDQPHPGPDHRAPEAFRPDPTAPVSARDREALRPATAPSLANGAAPARTVGFNG